MRSKLKDQERQLAEMRLVMVGMGKAMSDYLSLSQTDNDVDASGSEGILGLGRIRDALLDSADRDIESLAQEWVWKESVERKTSSNGAGTASAPDKATEREGTPASVSQDTASSRSVTPATSDSAAMQAQTMPKMTKKPDTSFPSPSLPGSGASKPALYLSRRTDTAPITNLPRVPHSAPLVGARSTSDKYSKESPRGPDPLAGRDVVSVTNGAQGDRLKRASAVNDPLGAGF